MSIALSISNLTVVYNSKPVLWNVSASIPAGILMAIVGPNGAGKSTLIKSIVELVKPTAGTITIFGQSYAHQRHQIAYVPQRMSIDWDFPITVFDVVLMGRYGHVKWMARPSAHDKELTWQALEAVNMQQYAHTPISALSCGQQQRVFLARALTQEAEIYLMDEPFVGIDEPTEKATIALLKQLRSQGKTIIIVHHDLNTMHDYFDWALILNGKALACGPLDTIGSKEHVRNAYRAQSYQREL
jgi:manganese/zinc/iron transport system ATP- binding protein